jgi:hypothetical protein
VHDEGKRARGREGERASARMKVRLTSGESAKVTHGEMCENLVELGKKHERGDAVFYA